MIRQNGLLKNPKEPNPLQKRTSGANEAILNHYAVRVSDIVNIMQYSPVKSDPMFSIVAAVAHMKSLTVWAKAKIHTGICLITD